MYLSVCVCFLCWCTTSEWSIRVFCFFFSRYIPVRLCLPATGLNCSWNFGEQEKPVSYTFCAKLDGITRVFSSLLHLVLCYLKKKETKEILSTSNSLSINLIALLFFSYSAKQMWWVFSLVICLFAFVFFCIFCLEVFFFVDVLDNCISVFCARKRMWYTYIFFYVYVWSSLLFFVAFFSSSCCCCSVSTYWAIIKDVCVVFFVSINVFVLIYIIKRKINEPSRESS